MTAIALATASITTGPVVAQAQPGKSTSLPIQAPLLDGSNDKTVSFRFTPLNEKIKEDIFKNRMSTPDADSKDTKTTSTKTSSHTPTKKKKTTTTTKKSKKKKATVTVTITPAPDPDEDLTYPPEWDGYVDDDTSGIKGIGDGPSVDLSSLDLGKASKAAKEAVKHAFEQLGTPYVWGGTTMSSPNAADGGLDCSGLTQGVYSLAGISIPRVTYSQVSAGTAVPMAQIQPGDLVFYSGTGHVAIYVGDGNVIHAPQPGEVVKVSSINMMPVEAIRRVA